LEYYYSKGYRGFVIEGTGLGHVSTDWLDTIGRISDESLIVMTSQCLWGRVCDRVYDTGRYLLEAGVVEGEDMLPEVAYIKLGWALGQTDDPEKVKSLMLTPVNDEITDREPYNGYLVYQGGVPEVEEFIRKVEK